MRNNDPRPQVIIVKQESPWLRRLVLFLLFGWFYPAIAFVLWCVKVSWKLFVAYPWRFCVYAARQSVKGAKWFHAKYSWRGWAILSAVVIVLGIIGNLTSH